MPISERRALPLSRNDTQIISRNYEIHSCFAFRVVVLFKNIEFLYFKVEVLSVSFPRQADKDETNEKI